MPIGKPVSGSVITPVFGLTTPPVCGSMSVPFGSVITPVFGSYVPCALEELEGDELDEDDELELEFGRDAAVFACEAPLST